MVYESILHQIVNRIATETWRRRIKNLLFLLSQYQFKARDIRLLLTTIVHSYDGVVRSTAPLMVTVRDLRDPLNVGFG